MEPDISTLAVVTLASDVLPVLAYLVVVMAIYAVGGWLWETAYCSLVERRFVRRGVMYGPSCPLYGFAMAFVYYPFLSISNPFVLFVAGTLLSTAMEYGTAVILESAFHRSFWSYDNLPFNVRGRVCLPASLLFGTFTLLVRYVIQPVVEPVLDAIPPDRLCDIGLVVTLLFFIDLAMSARRWELDTTRMPARVAVIVQRIPDSVRTPEEISDIVTDAVNRIRDEWSASVGSLRGERHRHIRVPKIRIVSAKKISDGKLFVIARIGEMSSVISTMRESISGFVSDVARDDSDESIVKRALLRHRRDDGEEEDS